MNQSQPKKGDVPRVTGDVRPESDPTVATSAVPATEGKKSDWSAVDDAAARAKTLESEKDPRAKVEAIVTSQVMLPPEKDADGNQIAGGRVARRGDRITVSREFFKKYRGHYVETPEEFERLERKARGEDDF